MGKRTRTHKSFACGELMAVPRFTGKKLPPHWIYVPSRKEIRDLLGGSLADVRRVEFGGTGSGPGRVGLRLGYLEQQLSMARGASTCGSGGCRGRRCMEGARNWPRRLFMLWGSQWPCAWQFRRPRRSSPVNCICYSRSVLTVSFPSATSIPSISIRSRQGAGGPVRWTRRGHSELRQLSG